MSAPLALLLDAALRAATLGVTVALLLKLMRLPVISSLKRTKVSRSG